MPRHRRAIVALCVGLLICAPLAPAVAVADDATSEPLADDASPPVESAAASAGGFSLQETDQEFDRTEFRITVHDDGSATWQFRYERTLETDEDVEDFEAFAEEFNTEETELFVNFRDRAATLADDGSAATDREMAATEFQREATVAGLDDNLGVVRLSFRWDGFAAVDGDRIVVGDVFAGGLYISPDQRLVVERGDGIVFDEVQPDPDERAGETLTDSQSVTWFGERSFTDNRPRVVFRDADAVAPADPAVPSWSVPVIAVVALLAAALIAFRRGLFSTDEQPTADETPPQTPATDDRPDTKPDAGDVARPDSAETSEPESAGVPDEELLPDDVRVKRLLETNGGRMKQVAIVEETGWSKSKVSMLLSEMEEEGEISKLRVGRENIISLSGHEPDAAGSPFEDE